MPTLSERMKETEDLLAKEGWIVECHSPFEIYHEETESRANGYAAEIILASIKIIM